MKTILAIVFLFIIYCVQAQSYVKARAINTFQDSSCLNTIIYEAYNLSPQAFVDHFDGTPDLIPITEGDTIYNFCSLPLSSLDYHRLDLYSSNGYVSTYETFSTIIPNELNFEFVNYTAPSSPTSSDGSVTIVFDSANVLSNYILEAFYQSNTVPDSSTIDAYSMEFTQLLEGAFFLHFVNPNNENDYIHFSIYIGNLADKYINTGLNPNFALQHASSPGSCDGWILQTVPGVSGTLFNIWNDGAYNESFRTNLCPGVYSLYNYDMVSGVTIAGSIDTLVLADNGLAYIDSSIYTTIPQDTMYINFQNCAFDYSAPIDSILYQEDTVFVSGNLTVLAYTMTMYQDSFFVSTSDTLTLLNDSLIMLDVVIYCDAFRSTFKSRRIVFLRGVDEHNFFQNGLELKEEESFQVQIYPNPTKDVVNFEFNKPGKYDLELFSSINQRILKDTFHNDLGKYELNVSHLSSGVYYVLVSSDESKWTSKIIIE